MSFRGGVSWFVAVVVGEYLDPLAQSFHVASEVHERSQHQLHIVSQLMVDSTTASATLPLCLLVRLFSIFLPPQKEDTIIGQNKSESSSWNTWHMQVLMCGRSSEFN